MNASSVQEPSQAELDAQRAASAEPSSSTQGDDQEEEEKECGWCKWMKAGGCGEPFQEWLKCVDDVKAQGRDDVEVCAKVMGPLFGCMERHKEYYAPQLDSLHKERSSEDAQEGAGQQPGQPAGAASATAAEQ